VRNEWSTDPNEFANVSPPEPDERVAVVIDAVESLPADLKAVIDCLFWEGLSNPAAIKALGISDSTFYRRLKDAKSRLATMLGGDVVGAMSTGDDRDL
jgi:DNA-directed RNA polymerase specialized sigma24 family protein